MYSEILLFLLFLIFLIVIICKKNKENKENKEEMCDSHYGFQPNYTEIGYPVCDYNCKKLKYEYCLVNGDC